MKRSIGASSESSRQRPSSQRWQDVPELPSEMWVIIFVHLQHCDEGGLKRASVVSKLCRESVFKSVKSVELSRSPVEGIFDGCTVGLGRFSVHLLPRFTNASVLRVFWAPPRDTFEGYLSRLTNITSLLVAAGDGILPRSVAHPFNLVDLTVTSFAHPSWRSISDAKTDNEEKEEGNDLSRFVNLERLSFDNSDGNFMDPAFVLLKQARISEDPSHNFHREIVSEPILPNLSVLEFVDTSMTVLDGSRLRLDKLKALTGTGKYCDFQRVRCIKDLVSLTELEIGQDAWTSFGRSLNALTNLKTLRLDNWQISGEDVSQLSGLVSLCLQGRCYSNFFDDLGPGNLAGLKELWLFCTGKADLSRLTGLTDLQLYECRISAESVTGLPHLVSLKLSHDHHGIDDRNIGSFTNLRSLIVSHSKGITGEGISQLTNLVSLTTTNVAGVGYDFPTKMTNLTRLDIPMLGRV